MQKKYILCPINFSEGTDKSIECALNLAKQFQAKLTVITVVEEFPLLEHKYPEAKKLQQALEEETHNKLLLLAEKYTLNKDQIKMITGDPKLKILQIADELGVDLIVINDPGHHGLRNQFMRSTTRIIANCANCDVYIVRN